MLEKDQALTSDEKTSKYLATAKKHASRLKEILAVIKLPSVKNLGKDGAKAAWLIAQHADFNPDFQRQFLKLMLKIYKKDPEDAYTQGIPYLTDRIQSRSKGFQTYGTQFYSDKQGGLSPYKVKAKKNLNSRRKRYGLDSYEDYCREIEDEYGKSINIHK